MPIPQKIIKYLEAKKLKYKTIKHKTVYTAFDKAATLKVPEKIVGKTLVVSLGRGFAFVLIPANKNLDKRKFLKVTNKWFNKKSVENSYGRIRPEQKSKILYGASIPRAVRRGLRYSHANFVSERWMKKNLKGVKIGAVPPFGAIFKLPTFTDSGFLKNPKIIINSGDYNWSVKITPANFKKAVPDLIIGNFSKVKK